MRFSPVPDMSSRHQGEWVSAPSDVGAGRSLLDNRAAAALMAKHARCRSRTRYRENAHRPGADATGPA